MTPMRFALVFLLSAIVAGVGTAWATSDMPKDVVLMLDNSGSMKQNDPEFLTSLAVREFLEKLKGDTHVALLKFDQDIDLIVPLTPLTEQSRSVFLESLNQIDFKGRLTDSPAAMERAIYEIKVNGRAEASKSIVFMTDGIVDTGDKARDLNKAQWLRQDLAAEAAAAQIRIFGIAFTEDADFEIIQSLARRTQGEYYRAFGAGDIDAVFDRINTVLAASEPEPTPAPLPELPPLEVPPPVAADSDVSLPPLPPLPEAQEPVFLPEPGSELTEPQPPEPARETTPEARAAGPAAQRAPTPTEGFDPRTLYVVLGALAVLALAVISYLVYSRRKGEEQNDDEVVTAYLNDLNDTTGQKSYELSSDKLTMIGRLPAEDSPRKTHIVIDETTIGRRHATIEFKNHGFVVRDQNSLNGTFVNNKRIEREVQLKHGDHVRFHKFDFEFVMPEMFGAGMTLFSQTVFADSPSASTLEDMTESPTGAEAPTSDEEVTQKKPGL